jgi:hypothetical protein
MAAAQAYGSLAWSVRGMIGICSARSRPSQLPSAQLLGHCEYCKLLGLLSRDMILEIRKLIFAFRSFIEAMAFTVVQPPSWT